LLALPAGENPVRIGAVFSCGTEITDDPVRRGLQHRNRGARSIRLRENRLTDPVKIAARARWSFSAKGFGPEVSAL
jgi:hypothetical protein